jgi:hypothetical protein
MENKLDTGKPATKKLNNIDIECQLTSKLKNIEIEKQRLISQMIAVKERYEQILEDEELCKTMIMHQYNKVYRGAYMMSEMKKLRDRGLLKDDMN